MDEYEVIWSLRATDELKSVGEYIARDRPKAAARVVAAILTRVAQLARFPFSGAKFQRRPEGQYREVSIGKYRIFYRVERAVKRIYIAAIWHGARREPPLP